MTKKDIETIEHVKAVMDYCNEHENCKGCVFHSDCAHYEDVCVFDVNSPCDWEVPKIKTYKEDFLEKFPNADFEAENICRNCVYPNAGKYPDCNTYGCCEKCWDEVCMEK